MSETKSLTVARPVGIVGTQSDLRFLGLGLVLEVVAHVLRRPGVGGERDVGLDGLGVPDELLAVGDGLGGVDAESDGGLGSVLGELELSLGRSALRRAPEQFGDHRDAGLTGQAVVLQSLHEDEQIVEALLWRPAGSRG